MDLRLLSLRNSILLASIKAKPGDVPDETIDGFPEFASTIDTINDPQVRTKLRALARRIAASHATPSKIIGFEVHGHADVTLRPPPGMDRQRFEDDVSADRADSAKDLLLQMIEEEGGKPFMTGIRANTSARGFGSRFNKFRPAQTEDQRRRNRRVEIFLKISNQPQPKPTPPEPPPPPKPPEPGTHWRIRIKAGNVTSISLPEIEISPVNMFLVVELTDLDRKRKARFHIHARGIQLPNGQLGPPTPVQSQAVTEGDEVEFRTTNGVTLEQFNGGIFVAQNPGAAFVLDTGGKFALSFNALGATRTRPSVVEVGGGFNLMNVVPQASLSIGPSPEEGSIKMVDAPQAIP
ncbi:hypothetical protein BN1110_05202 [bacterium YEK0313]|nr:hypothetical protein BN1110_05202 [bacterium YEK0313]